MGRLFDEKDLEKYIMHDGCEKGCGYIDERDLKFIPTVEAIPKADYENRLTTDMATIKQLSNSVKVLQKANSEIAVAYDKLKSDYKARLKDDLEAMLTEIQLEFEENTVRWYVGRVDGKSDDVVLMETINDIIQQKINALKAENKMN